MEQHAAAAAFVLDRRRRGPMTKETDITTERDPQQTRNRFVLMVMVWLAVYPIVTLLTYLTAGLDDLPTWVRTFLTTILTVPTITYLVVPNAKTIISKAADKA
jgi:antibiotic biosynthesis monooxygenase (ABM) superfamily enzyme